MVIQAPFLEKIKKIAIGTALAITPLPATFAGGDENGIDAYQAKQYDKAFEIFSRNADKSNPKVLFYLSSMYRTGKGVEQDEYMAFDLCKDAAEEGFAEAQFQLGMMYLHGEGVTEDDDQALEWLWAAADNGYSHAREILQFVLQNDFTAGC